MPNTFISASIATGLTIEAGHVTQSADAFTGTEAYDITISGSLTTTGTNIMSSSASPSITSILTENDNHPFITGVTSSGPNFRMNLADANSSGSAYMAFGRQTGNFGGTLECATQFSIGSAQITEAELEKIDGVTPGTASASKALVVDSSKNISSIGNLSASEVTATSDEKLKSDIKTIENGLDKVMKMRGVSFTKQAEKGIGVIAQEVEKIIPEVVHDGEYKSVAYGNMVGVLIEAIKELKTELDNHKQGCKCHGS